MEGRSPWRRWLLAAAAAGLLLRILLFLQYRGTAFAASPVVDALNYWDWAGRIAAGSWLPAEPFLQGPLYPYLLALGRLAVPGLHPAGVAAVQLLLNWGTCLLFFPLVRREAGERTALAAAVAALLFAPAAFFALKVLSTTVALFLLVAGLLLLPPRRGAPSFLRGLAGGAAWGAACLAAPQLLPVAVAGIAAWSLAGRDRSLPALFRSAAPLALGLLAAVSPATLTNARAGGGFTLINTNAGYAFFIGASPEARGVFYEVPGVAPNIFQMGRDMAELGKRQEQPVTGERYFYRKGMEFILEHPGEYLVLQVRKAALLLGGLDIPLEYSLTRERRDFLPLLWLFPAGGTLVILLAALSLAGGGSPPGVRLTSLMAGAAGATVLLFYAANRYDLPFPFLLIPLAGAAFTGPPRRFLRPLPIAAALVVAAAALWSLGEDRSPGYESGYLQNLASAAAADGRFLEAKATQEKAVRETPGDPGAWMGLAAILEQAGERDAAVRVGERVVAMDPASANTRLRLVAMLQRGGRLPEALARLAEAAALDPGNREIAQWRVELLLDQGEIAAASLEAERLVREAPSSPWAHFALGMVRGREGRFSQARDEFARATGLDPAFAAAYQGLAAADLRLGDLPSARRNLDRARSLGFPVDPRLEAEIVR